MKKGLFLLLVAICFASLSFAGVKFKPKVVSRDTEIANLREYVIKYNGAQKHRDLIKPGESYYFPTVKLGYERDTYSDPYLLIDVYPNDNFTKMSAIYLFGVAVPSLPMNKQVVDKVPAPASEPAVPGVESSDSGWLWFLLVVAFVFLLLAGYFAFINEKLKTEKEEIAKANERERKELERELEATKKKLPVVPPVLSNERWLRENSPVELTQNFDNQGNLVPTSATVERVFGKMPDLLVAACVSTKGNAVDMEFSYNRRATTGLSNVPVWLGYNWVKKSKQKAKWVEAGMVATACSNGFQNIKNILSMSQLFTSVELVNKTKHPVLSCSEKVPEGTLYPELVSKLVVKYHENDIKDLRKAGLVVEPPKAKKEKK